MPLALIAIAALLLPFALKTHNGATFAGVGLIITAIVMVALGPSRSKK